VQPRDGSNHLRGPDNGDDYREVIKCFTHDPDVRDFNSDSMQTVSM